MKILSRKRLLSLLLALAMVLSMIPAALAAGNDGSGGEDGEEGSEGTTEATESTEPTSPSSPSTPSDGSDHTLHLSLTQGNRTFDTASGLQIDQISSSSAPTINVRIGARDSQNKEIRDHENDHIAWVSADPDVAEPHISSSGGQATGRTVFIEAKKPGVTTVTGTVTNPDGSPSKAKNTTITFQVTVSGIVPISESITIKENESRRLTGYTADNVNAEDPYGVVYYGAAANGAVSVTSNQPSVVEIMGNDRNGVSVDGISAGSTFIAISVGSYTGRITVNVEADESYVIEAEASVSEPLKFSTLEAKINELCQRAIEGVGNTVVSITGLTVSTTQGTIYLGYKSPDDTGAGAGSSLTYYGSSQPRGPYIKDLTFVPNPSYAGEKAVINFTGRAENNRTFKGKIEITLEETQTDLLLTTRADVPLRLSAENFSKVCQEQTGSPLRYVIFTLPPSNQGVLYRDYKNELDYGSRVLASEQYDRKGLDGITFVPAAGYVGPVTIGYAGYSTTGGKYTGELVINVTRSLDENIQYQDYGAGEITFDSGDFDSYSEAMTGETLRSSGWVSFTLPPASQGALYYRRGGGRGSAVAADETFGRSQLDYVTFVAADGFDGVVRIPFTGADRNGVEFSGTVELHIQSNEARSGDIFYTCQPDQSVKLQLADFADLCLSATGQRLYYVTFQSLPDNTQGALFYNRSSSGGIGTRVSTAAKYFNSAVPYLSGLSFWAGRNFSSVEIPFTLAAVDGQTITGLLTISNGEGPGDGRTSLVTYATTGQQPVTFTGASFDAVCRQAANSALSYIRLSLPGSGQGILYYDYKAGGTLKTLDPNTNLYLTGGTSIDKVTFLPARDFSGAVYLSFTAAAINGQTFQGMVEITVRPGAAYGGIVHYTTGGAPVRFQSQDLISTSGIGLPSGIRFTGMPSASQGRVYYQYASPTQYSWLGNTTTTYSVTGDPMVSNLTFIPKAGYQGIVSIPYEVTGYDGSVSTGSIQISVEDPLDSLNFDDLGSCSGQTRAAVDYLSSQNVVHGTAYRVYSPGAAIRRGDFCLMLSRAFQLNVTGANQSFGDVAYDAYYGQAVREMYALGVVNGVGGSRFLPEASITRQDAAVMVKRILDKAGLSLPEGSNEAALAGYKDRNQVDGYARDALGSLVRAGIFPVSGDQLNPKAAITRADMALLLHRAMTNFS